jgi:hypothetical protein
MTNNSKINGSFLNIIITVPVQQIIKYGKKIPFLWFTGTVYYVVPVPVQQKNMLQ